MDIRKFEVFLDLAKTLSYTETAERLLRHKETFQNRFCL